MTRREILVVVAVIVLTTVVGILSQVSDAPNLRLIWMTALLPFVAFLFYRKVVQPNRRSGRRKFR